MVESDYGADRTRLGYSKGFIFIRGVKSYSFNLLGVDLAAFPYVFYNVFWENFPLVTFRYVRRTPEGSVPIL